MHVLLVEDEPAVLKAVGKLLQTAGHTVTHTANGLEAFAALERGGLDAVVCDIRMPSLGGVGFFEQVEERFPVMAGRTIFVTAFADEPPVRKFLEQTGQPFFAKPFRPPELLAQVERIGPRSRPSS